jgi:hypothetical protein
MSFMSTAFWIPARSCGLPHAANGGYLAGRLSAWIAGPAEVTLRRTTPLARGLRVEPVEGGVDLYDGDSVVAQARGATVEVRPPRPVSLEEAAAGARAFPRFVDHPVPRCFVCGTARPPGDGLRIFPGPVPGREEIYAAPWVPDRSLADEEGMVRREHLWAALDCPGAFAVNEPPRGLALLGRIAVTTLRQVPVGESLVVLAWPISREGRKLHPGTAIFTDRGEPVALAHATWLLTAR